MHLLIIPSSGESVFARCLSSLKDERTAASKVFPAPTVDLSKYKSNTKEYIEQIRQVHYALSYSVMYCIVP